jgi:hypothetical protein
MLYVPVLERRAISWIVQKNRCALPGPMLKQRMSLQMVAPNLKTADQTVPGLEWMSIGHLENDAGMNILTLRDQDKKEFRVAVSERSIGQLIASLINAAGRTFAAKVLAAGKPAMVPGSAVIVTATGLGLATEANGPMLMIRSGGVDLFFAVDKELLVETCQKVVDEADQLPDTRSPDKQN